MFKCCLRNSPETVKSDSFEVKMQENLNSDNYILPDKIYFYQILISRLLEASNYIINSDQKEHYSISFVYYFFVFIGSSYLINNNLDKFIEYFYLETYFSNILEIIKSAKLCLKSQFDISELESIVIFIIKLDERSVFEKPNMFLFKIDGNILFKKFFTKYKNLNNTEFEEMKAHLRTLMLAIDEYILSKFLSDD